MRHNRIMTIEKTSKDVKACSALGWCVFWLSIYLLFSHHVVPGAILFWFSLFLIVLARVGRWWKNG